MDTVRLQYCGSYSARKSSPHMVCGYNTEPPLWWKVIDKFDLRSGSSFQTYGLGIKVSEY